MKKGMNGKKHSPLMMRLMICFLVPLFLSIAVISIYSMESMRRGMVDEFLDGLKDEAIALKASCMAMDPGDYYLNESGQLMKGNTNLSEDEELLDPFADGSDIAVTLFYGDTRKATTLIGIDDGKRMIGTQASAKVAQTVLSGEEYFATSLEINKQPYMAYYMPMKNSDGSIVGMYFAGAPSKGINEYITARLNEVLMVTVVFVVLAIILVFIVTRLIVKSVKMADDSIEKLANGDLVSNVDQSLMKRKDEIGEMGRSMDNTIGKLREIIGRLNESANEMQQAGVSLDEMASTTAKTTEEVSNAVTELSKGATMQAEEVENATNHVVDMGHQIEQIVASIKELYDASSNVETASEDAKQNMNRLQEYNRKTSEAIGNVSNNVKETDQSVEAIKIALDMISEIAEETNLLSLNASIEAARAGEAGRGFAVVASQIQKLAEESAVSSSRIAEIIEKLSRDSANTMSVMDTVRKDVEEQQQVMEVTLKCFETVTEGIGIVNDHAGQINVDAQGCDRSREKVVDIIQSLSALSEENAASTEETSASMQELNGTVSMLADAAGRLQGLASEVKEDIRYFHV